MPDESRDFTDAEADQLTRRAMVGLGNFLTEAIEKHAVSTEGAELLAKFVQTELLAIRTRVFGAPGSDAPNINDRRQTLKALGRMYPEPLEARPE
jgi:hypothetical protein